MLYRAYEYTDDAPSHNGLDKKAEFEAEIRKTRGRIRRSLGKRMAPAKVGPPGWRGLNLLRNDTDITHR
jgi:hypothetical protein